MICARVILAAALGCVGSPYAAAESLQEAAKSVLTGQQRAARVELTDELAAYVRKTTRSSSAVYADISVLKDLPQPDCKRLRVQITAPEAIVTDSRTGKQRPFLFHYEINLCADGSPPSKL